MRAQVIADIFPAAFVTNVHFVAASCAPSNAVQQKIPVTRSSSRFEAHVFGSVVLDDAADFFITARHLAGYAGILQADAGACPRAAHGADPGAGFGDLYDGRRKPGPIIEAACWSHSRRKFFELADLRKAPLAVEAVRRIDELFAIERTINGMPAGDRVARRQRESRPVVADLENWMHAERARLSRHAETARQSTTC